LAFEGIRILQKQKPRQRNKRRRRVHAFVHFRPISRIVSPSQVSREGESFTVPVEVAKMSVLCKDMMEGTLPAFVRSAGQSRFYGFSFLLLSTKG
jgi:hypothetical protein